MTGDKAQWGYGAGMYDVFCGRKEFSSQKNKAGTREVLNQPLDCFK